VPDREEVLRCRTNQEPGNRHGSHRTPLRLGNSGEGFPDDAPPNQSGWPLSGPFDALWSRVGGAAFLLVFTATSALSLARSLIGNHVLIRHAEGEYGLYAHLVPGSVEVEPEDRVEQEQIIGCCGHSGHSSEPYLHFHLQDSAALSEGMGLPVEFSSVEVDGASVHAAHLTAGQLVRNG
jgi:hypothetical protein